MSKISTPISTHQELLAERIRLMALIEYQKNLIQEDIEAIKEEIAERVHPLAETASFVKKLTTKETRNASLLQIGGTLLIEVLVRKWFAKSSLIVRLLLPNLVRNYSTHLLFSAFKNKALKRNNGLLSNRNNTHQEL